MSSPFENNFDDNWGKAQRESNLQKWGPHASLRHGADGEGRKASLIAQQYARGERIPKAGIPQADKHPTNEEVAKAVQQKVAVRTRSQQDDVSSHIKSCPIRWVTSGCRGDVKKVSPRRMVLIVRCRVHGGPLPPGGFVEDVERRTMSVIGSMICLRDAYVTVRTSSHEFAWVSLPA